MHIDWPLTLLLLPVSHSHSQMGQWISWALCHYIPQLAMCTANSPTFLNANQGHVSPKYIVPGAQWYDTDGNNIQSHGAGILKVNTTYYWFGEDKSLNDGLFHAVSCYNSSDLYSWTRLPDALTPLVNTTISSSSVVERPKVVYNAKNDEYVMWFHSDNAGYTAAMVGVAKSKTPEGPYNFTGSFKPLGADSRDEGLFIDDDLNRTAYLLYASDNNGDFKIAQLDENYYNVSQVTYVFSDHYEAPGIIKRNGTYYLFVSGLTGWSANANQVVSAPTIAGPWSSETNLAPPSSRTYNSQNAYDLWVNNTAVYFGDRWNANQLGSSTYVWLPMQWVNGTPSLLWADIWTLDVPSGAVTIPNGTSYYASAGFLNGSSQLGFCESCYSGSAVTWLGAGGSVTLFNITGTGWPQWVSLYYANGDGAYRNVSVSVNGGPALVVDQPDTGSGSEFLSVPVKLTFNNGTHNNITFGANQPNYAGDMDRIIVYPS